MSELPKLPKTGLTEPEAHWLIDQAAALPEDAVIVHIGVAMGASLLCSRAGNETAYLLGIDTRMDRIVDGLGDVADLIQADSRTMGYDRPVDFLLVDGAHDQGSVLADTLNWHGRIKEGGIIAFHDYGNYQLRWCKGVKLAVDAWDWRGWEEIEAVGSIRAFRKVEAE